MGTSTIPVDLRNPGQVFACVGFMEAAEILLGPATGRFDYAGGEVRTTFTITVEGDADPVETVLRFLLTAEARAISPDRKVLSTEKWQVETDLYPPEPAADAEAEGPRERVFPVPLPDSPAALPIRLVSSDRRQAIPIDHWGDGTDRDNVKFWAGAAGYPGAGLARDALKLVAGMGDSAFKSALVDPFAIAGPQSSSFRFDWRRDYIPMDVGFSPNQHGGMIMVGFPIVELLAAIGLQHARPAREVKLLYRYGVSNAALPTLFARAVLGAADLGFPIRTFAMRLGWPGQEDQARAIIDAQEETTA